MQVLRNNQIIREYTPAPSKHAPRVSSRPTALLSAIRAAEQRGVTLSSRELMRECGISSTSVVAAQLRRLARDGDLVIGPKGASRSYRLTSKGRGASTPDEALLRRCLEYLERELGATGGGLVEDLRKRLT